MRSVANFPPFGQKPIVLQTRYLIGRQTCVLGVMGRQYCSYSLFSNFFICCFVVTIAITTLYTVVYGVTTNGTVSTHYVFCSQPAGAREKFRGAREKFRGAREIYCGARRFFRGARVMAGVVVTLHFVVTS